MEVFDEEVVSFTGQSRPPRQLVLRVAPESSPAVLLLAGRGASETQPTVEREEPLSLLVGWSATNVGISLDFGASRPSLFFGTRRGTEVSDVLLRTLTRLRSERDAAAGQQGEEGGIGRGEETEAIISIDTVRPVPPYAGTRETH